MNYDEVVEKRKEDYLRDIEISINLLQTLKVDYITPGTFGNINTRKITRIRLTINDLLKRH